MSETVSDPHRLTALELANHHVGEAPNQIVDRAHAYHAFLTGKAPGKPATAGTTQTAAAAAQPAAAATGKPATATPTKPAAATATPTKPAAAKATPAPGTKPAATTKPAAAAPKPAAAAPKPAATKPAATAAATAPVAGQNPPDDTKDPNGKNTFKNVCNALAAVKSAQGVEAAKAVMKKAGGGAGWVRDVKPTLYDAVVGACEQALKPPKATATGAVVVTDELGGEIDTSGASAATAGADDPPEGGSGDPPAEDM